MNYMAYYPIDVINGPGTRCTLFVSYCTWACKGCFQKKSWPKDAGFNFTEELEDKIIADLKDLKIKRRGLTLSGGDPLNPHNVPDVLKLIKRVKNESPDSDIWCWTGYELEALEGEQLEILALIDVLIDGKFIQELKDPSLLWRGSSNQRIHFLSDRAKKEDYIQVKIS